MRPIHHLTAPCIRWLSCDHRQAPRIVLLAAVPVFMVKGIAQTPHLVYSSERSGQCQVYHVPLPGTVDQGMPVRGHVPRPTRKKARVPTEGLLLRGSRTSSLPAVCVGLDPALTSTREMNIVNRQTITRVLVAHGFLEIWRRRVSLPISSLS